MNPHLSEFLRRYLSVAFAILILVFTVAFVALPYIFKGHPGDASEQDSSIPNHPATPPQSIAPTPQHQ
jgi:hypothetical protein